MIEWIRTHDTALWWMATFSLVFFLATLILVPVLVVRIPPDYFTHGRHRTRWFATGHPVVRALGMVGKNTLGLVFIFAGLVMLGLPGQGLLTILLGIMLTDFPAKYRLECWVVRRRPAMQGINWLRGLAGRAPLEPPRRGTQKRRNAETQKG